MAKLTIEQRIAKLDEQKKQLETKKKIRELRDSLKKKK